MKPCSSIFRFKHGIQIFVILLTIFACVAASQAAGLNAAHRIQVELVPDEMRLKGSDDITIQTNGIQVLEFRLSERISKLKVEVNQNPRNFNFENGRLGLNLEADEQFHDVQVSIHYSAIFDDPVSVRPVNTDNPGFGVVKLIHDGVDAPGFNL